MVQSQPKTTAGDAFFLSELDRLGPDQPRAAWDLRESQRYCEMWAKHQYENFTVVSFLLPRRIRQDFYNIYAYCRWSDNLGDEVDDAEKSLELLEWWKRQLQLCYSGRPAHPVMVALQDSIHRHNLPSDLFTDLLSAFRQDQSVTRYDNDQQLNDYCKRSANPVGRLLLHLTDNRQDTNDQNLAWSDEICTGLQIANFCQDMSRDAGIGRIYMPRSRWQGFSEQTILTAKPDQRMQAALREWVQFARDHFLRGMPLIDHVPRWLALDVDLFVQGGLEILKQVESLDYDVWTRRPEVSKLSKIKLLCGTFLRHRVFGRRKRTANA